MEVVKNEQAVSNKADFEECKEFLTALSEIKGYADLIESEIMMAISECCANKCLAHITKDDVEAAVALRTRLENLRKEFRTELDNKWKKEDL